MLPSDFALQSEARVARELWQCFAVRSKALPAQELQLPVRATDLVLAWLLASRAGYTQPVPSQFGFAQPARIIPLDAPGN